MSYRTVAYAVDVDRLRSAFGSHDQALLRSIEEKFASEIQDKDANPSVDFLRGAPTLREALDQIVRGEITAPAGTEFQYGYATELLCMHLGHELDNDDLIAFVDDLEIPTRLTTSGPPLPVPPPDDFPVIGYLSAPEVRDEYARLKDQDLTHDDEDIAAARDEFRSYLHQAFDRGLGLVTFAY